MIRNRILASVPADVLRQFIANETVRRSKAMPLHAWGRRARPRDDRRKIANQATASLRMAHAGGPPLPSVASSSTVNPNRSYSGRFAGVFVFR